MIAHLRHWLHRRRHPLRYAHLDALLRTQALPRAGVPLLHRTPPQKVGSSLGY